MATSLDGFVGSSVIMILLAALSNPPCTWPTPMCCATKSANVCARSRSYSPAIGNFPDVVGSGMLHVLFHGVSLSRLCQLLHISKRIATFLGAAYLLLWDKPTCALGFAF